MEFYTNLPRLLAQPHFLQTVEWAQIKSEVGWTSELLTWEDENGKTVAAAQVLFRSVKLLKKFGPSLTIGYIPRGPLLDWSDTNTRNRVLRDLETLARKKKLIFLKIDPELEIGRGIPGSGAESANRVGEDFLKQLQSRGWKFSPDQIQFKNTVLLDLAGTEEDWLARMKQKTRYNLRLAQKSGVVVRKAAEQDLPTLYRMFAETAHRDGFIIRPEAYYLGVWKTFIQSGMAEGLIAEVDGTAVAGLVFTYFGGRAWYVYGMSTQLHREKMPNYLLQWEAMRSARQKGCDTYDLWGAPEVFDNSDPMFGVYRFKEGLGGEVVRTVGAWDFPVRPFIYFLYLKVIPRILAVTRSIRRRQIKQEVM